MDKRKSFKLDNGNAKLASGASGSNMLNKPIDKLFFMDTKVEPKSLFRWFYDANPLYLISTCLLLYAQTVIFNTGNLDLNTAVSIGIIAAYTLLLTGAAILLARYARVWNDLRSLVLIIVVLLFVLSAGLDRKIIDGWQTGLLWQGGGLLLALTVGGVLYHELKIRLEGSILSVFCVWTGLFYLYPAIPAFLVNESGGDPVPAIRAVMLFPVIAGIFCLFLIPAIRQGKAVVKSNPSPWRWPYCPWIIFGIFWLCTAFRTYLLTISFYGGSGVGPYTKLETGFNIYMLIPLVLPVCVLLAEYGIARQRRWARNAALAGPVLFFLMAVPLFSTPRPYYQFLEAVLGKNGSPVIFSAIASILFYIYALVRRIRYTEISFASIMFIISLGEAKFSLLHALGIPLIPGWLPAALTMALLIIIAVRRRSAASHTLCFSALLLIILLLCRDTWFTAYRGIIPVSIYLTGLMTIMNIYSGKMAQILNRLTAFGLPFMVIFMLFSRQSMPWYYFGAVVVWFAGLGIIQAWVFHDRKFIVSEAAILAVAIIFGFRSGARTLEGARIRGLNIVCWSLAFFCAAFVLSLIKGGIPQKLYRRYLLDKNQS